MTRPLLIAALVAGSSTAQQIKVVPNAPFSATQVTQTLQPLADGNKVTRITTVSIMRDSEGRTRREQGNAVFIVDPVAGTAYVLDSKAKTVRKYTIQSAPATAPEVRQTTGTIDGLAVETSNLHRTIAAGEAGNDAALGISSQVSWSPELQEPILTRTIDPRTGETTTQLKDIKRAEPDHRQFEVPLDFVLAEAAGKEIK